MNGRGGRKDESDLFRKVELRRRIGKDVGHADIFLAGAGFGQMYRQVWRAKARYALALDTNPHKIEELKFQYPSLDVRVGDFGTFTDWPRGRRFEIADFDASGNLYPGIAHFFDNAPWRLPFYAVVGDGGPLAFSRNGHLPAAVHRAAPYAGPRDMEAYMERMVWPWWWRQVKRRGLEVLKCAWIANSENTVVYYALKLGNAGGTRTGQRNV